MSNLICKGRYIKLTCWCNFLETLMICLPKRTDGATPQTVQCWQHAFSVVAPSVWDSLADICVIQLLNLTVLGVISRHFSLHTVRHNVSCALEILWLYALYKVTIYLLTLLPGRKWTGRFQSVYSTWGCDFATACTADYREWEVQRRERVKADTSYRPSSAQFEGTSNYTTDYIPHPGAPRQSMKPNEAAKMSEQPFEDATDYRQSYVKYPLPPREVSVIIIIIFLIIVYSLN